jgi:hypothetical protein
MKKCPEKGGSTLALSDYSWQGRNPLSSSVYVETYVDHCIRVRPVSFLRVRSKSRRLVPRHFIASSRDTSFTIKVLV